MMNNYGNCSNFKVCPENDEMYKFNDNIEDKDYRMLISTPPSNANKGSKCGIMVNSTHNGIALFTCTPKDEARKNVKDENVKPTTMFS
jgi:hypothetical protein